MSAFGQTEAPPPEAPKPKATAHPAAPAPIAGKPLSKPASPVEASLRVAQVVLSGLIDRSVVGRDKTEIGHVIDVLVDGKGDEQALVVDVGGFMGVGNRKIALSRALVHVIATGKDAKDNQSKTALQVDLDSAQVRSAPQFNGPGDVSVVTGAAALPKPAAAPAGPTAPDAKGADKPAAPGAAESKAAPAAPAATTSSPATQPAHDPAASAGRPAP